ncbi:hypothetical protein BDV93DRAFT_557459 [Ceratobasidium sp. AG-I]|nr:hypothetical protein BDV93DRAFT_557459 [Ceratobasidium sp. AG-I]
MNLPLEIFMEVVSHTDPGDLLSLAWTCKIMRKVLMAGSAAHVWRTAEDGVLGLPNCPQGMHLASYAALVFTKICTRTKIDTLVQDRRQFGDKLDQYLLAISGTCLDELDETKAQRSKW